MELVAHLLSINFFQHLTPEQAGALASHFHLLRYIGGDDIITQGQHVDHFFIVEEGYINLRHTEQNGLEKPIGSKGPGEYFGIKMFTTQEPSEYTFEAVSSASLWVLDRKEWDHVLEEHPDIIEHMPELRQEYARLTRGLDWLAPGEIVDVMMRRHWWALILMIRVPLITAIIFALIYFISSAFGVPERLSWFFPLFMLALFACLAMGLWSALNWWNDVYIVTNKRVVAIRRVLFFSDSRAELAIEKIQSQKVDRGGPISVILNVSDLRITSASSDAEGVLFKQVGDVLAIQRAISGEQRRVQERNRAMERERLRNQISTEIHHYVLKEPAAPDETPEPIAPLPTAPVPGKAVVPTGLRRSPFRSFQILPRRRRRVVRKQDVPFQKRLYDTLNSLFGTEIRQGKVVTWRKDYFILLKQIGLWLLLLVVFLALFSAVVLGGQPLGEIQNGVYLSLGAITLIALAGVVWQWLDWRVDLYRLTESEIYDIESLPFGLRYRESKADLSRIQDVTYAREGFINTLLDYGDVVTRVAGNAEPFTFRAITHPRVVSDEISERIEVLKLRATDRVARENTRSIVDAIVAYHRLVMAERHQDAPPPVSSAPVVDESPVEPPPLALPPPFRFEIKDEFPPESDLTP